MKVCAFCGEEKQLTREHIWPSAFLDRVGRTSAHYSPVSGKVHGADYVVSDVCATCNNVHLTQLDDYFCDLYDSQLATPMGFGQSVHFQYNHDLLCRALLKIAYNTARSAGSECQPFQRVRSYILRGGTCPSGIAVLAELVSPTLIVSRPGEGEDVKEVRPTMYRSARGELLTPNGNTVLVRVVAVNSFFFHILILREERHIDRFARAVEEFLAAIEGTLLLSPTAGEVLLHSSPQDSLSSMLPLLKAKRDQYGKFFERRRSQRKKDRG
jgi:hypothetical protein